MANICKVLGNKELGDKYELEVTQGPETQIQLSFGPLEEVTLGQKLIQHIWKSRKEMGEGQNTPPHPESACLGLLVCGLGILSSTATSLEGHNNLSSNPATAIPIPKTKLKKTIPRGLLKLLQVCLPPPPQFSRHLEEQTNTGHPESLARALKNPAGNSSWVLAPLRIAPFHLFRG